MEASSKEDRRFIYMLTCFATLGLFIFGYDTGTVSGSMILIRKYFELSKLWQETLVGATVAAAALACLVAGYLSDVFGRRRVILMASLVVTAGVAVTSTSVNKYMLLLGRVIVGVGIGFASMIVPLYVAECAPSSIRGRLVACNQLSVTSGIVISSLSAGALSGDLVNGWKYMFGLGAIPPILMFVGFIFLPESPRWLVKNGQIQEAEDVLIRLRQQSAFYVKAELNTIRENIEDIGVKLFTKREFTLKKILTTPHVRKALFIGCMLQAFQQLCGVNTVIYYSASILQMAGFPDNQAIWWACLPNALNLLCTCIGLYFVERTGKKKKVPTATLR